MTEATMIPTKFACPKNVAHGTFAARHIESVNHLFTASGEYIEDESNTYDSPGYEGALYCRDCQRAGVETIIASDANEVVR